MSIIPLGSHVLLQLDEKPAEQTTASGLVIPAAVEQKDEIVPATALAVGPSVTEVKANDRVLAKKYLADPIKIDGQDRLLIEEEDIIARVVEETA